MPRFGALDYQVLNIGFGPGLFTKTDARFNSPPTLDIANDIQFEEIGGIQTRPPMVAMSNSIVGGGTLSNCRFLAVVNSELCVFTDVALYSWSSQLNAWSLRATHLAASVTETARFVTTGDQIDADRAELSGTVVYAWTEGSQVYAAALDKSTGSVLVSPTAVSTAVGRPRLVALSTKILLFTDAGGNNLTARAIDPASPSTAISGAGTTVLATNFNAYYDAAKIPTLDTAIVAVRRTTTTSYSILKVTSALAVSSATPARTCDGPIAIAADPVAGDAQIIRANGANIQGDLVTVSGLADVLTGQAIGTAATTPVNQVTVEYSTVKVGGQYVATAWWSAGENAGTGGFQVRTNTVDQAGAIGTFKSMPAWLGLASRAFERNGSIYAWMVFAGDSTVSGTGTIAGLRAQGQNVYLLYRSDATWIAKATGGNAGGLIPSTGRLPGVTQTDTNSFSWCGAQRRIIDLGGNHTGYADRDPNDVIVTFDDNAARRSVQFGRTLYVTGGVLHQYDGTALVELGFQVYPWSFATAPLGGVIPAGTYYYKCTERWNNAQGEQERSTTATVGSFVSPGASKASIPVAALTVTKKTGSVRSPAMEVWRTVISPGLDTPFFLTTSKDPNAVGDNGYLANDATSGGFLSAFNDNFTDATLITKEANPENGPVLEALVPPGATIAIATDVRLFIAGIPGDPDRVWYSRERGDGEIASFNDTLTIDVPPAGGSITAIWVMDDVLYVGRQTAIYALPGVGFANDGSGQNYGPAQIVSLDVGPVSQEAQALTPIGTVFKSAKGWYLLERGRGLRYIGGAVDLFDTDTVLAMTVLTSKHQVRILTNNRLIMWDYRGPVDIAAINDHSSDGLGSWAPWTINDGLHALLWNGSYVYLTATGPKIEQSSFSGMTYGMDVESSWIKVSDLQGYGKVGAIMALGEYRSAHLLRVRVARDYQYDGSGNVIYFDDKAWAPTPTTVGSALQVRHTPSASNGNCEAIKVRLTAVAEQTRATLATATALSPVVATSGTTWTATWQAANTTFPNLFPGVMGNSISMALSFETGANLVDVRDHFTYSASLGRWLENQNRIGVRVVCQAGALTVAALEAAIVAGTKLATLSAADATPSKTINIAAMTGQVATGAFSGGAYTSPSGEALKLTGLGLEIGLKPGLYKRLPAAQKQ